MARRALCGVMMVLVVLFTPLGVGIPVDGPEETCLVPSQSSLFECVDWRFDWADPDEGAYQSEKLSLRQIWAEDQVLTTDGSLLVVAGSVDMELPVVRAFDGASGAIVWEHAFTMEGGELDQYDKLFVDEIRGVVVLVAISDNSYPNVAEAYGITMLNLTTGGLLFETLEWSEHRMPPQNSAADYDPLEGTLFVTFNHYTTGPSAYLTRLDSWSVVVREKIDTLEFVLPPYTGKPYDGPNVWQLRVRSDLAFIQTSDFLFLVDRDPQQLVWEYECSCYSWEIVPDSESLELAVLHTDGLSRLDGHTGAVLSSLDVTSRGSLVLGANGIWVITAGRHVTAVASDLSEVLWTQPAGPKEDLFWSRINGLAYAPAVGQVVSVARVTSSSPAHDSTQLTYFDAQSGTVLHSFSYDNTHLYEEWFPHLDIHPAGDSVFAGGTEIIRHTRPQP